MSYHRERFTYTMQRNIPGIHATSNTTDELAPCVADLRGSVVVHDQEVVRLRVKHIILNRGRKAYLH